MPTSLALRILVTNARGSMTAESSVIGNTAANFSSPTLIRDSLRELWV
jgi:hypothetical protein